MLAGARTDRKFGIGLRGPRLRSDAGRAFLAARQGGATLHPNMDFASAEASRPTGSGPARSSRGWIRVAVAVAATIGTPAAVAAAPVPGVAPDAPARGTAAAPPARAPAAIDGIEIDSVLVKLAPTAFAEIGGDGVRIMLDGRPAAGSEAVLASIGAIAVERASLVEHADAERAARIGLDRWVRLTLEPGRDPHAGAAALRFVPGVEVAEVDGIGGLAEDLVPDDAQFANQWSMQNTGQSAGGVAGDIGADVDAPGAWGLSTGGRQIVIGVLDGGVSWHPDLDGRILPGWNVPQGNDNAVDGCSSHGTHVAGIIGALGDNGTAVAGLCWDVRILPVVVVNPCSGLESWVADGITWAVDHGAEIINMSLQYSAGTQYLHDAVLYAAEAGIPMLAATGNSGATPPSFPSRWPETIAVAATNNLDERWISSNYGTEVDVAAPGVAVLSLSATGGTTTKTGTSMAAPHATGIVALMRSVNASLTEPQIRSVLQSTADDVDAPGFDVFTGHGRLNAHEAVALAIAMGAVPGDLDGDGVVDGSDLGSLLGYWGPCEDCGNCPADFDGDCDVGGSDLGTLLGNWTGS